MNPSPNAGLVGRLKNIPLVRRMARAVGLIRVEAANPDHYHGDVARGYLEKRLQQESWHREQEVVQDMLRRLPEGVAVLDVPVGTGRFVDMFLERGLKVTGVDLSQDMLDMARETLGERYERCEMIRASAVELPFADGGFDIVVCFRFFGLIPLTLSNRVLGELRRTTAPGGHLIIRVPVRKEGAPPLPPAVGEEPLGGRLYRSELIAMFTEHGFVEVESSSVEEREHVSYVVYLLALKSA